MKKRLVTVLPTIGHAISGNSGLVVVLVIEAEEEEVVDVVVVEAIITLVAVMVPHKTVNGATTTETQTTMAEAEVGDDGMTKAMIEGTIGTIARSAMLLLRMRPQYLLAPEC